MPSMSESEALTDHPRPERRQARQFAETRLRGYIIRLTFEARLTVTWAWLLPMVGILLTRIVLELSQTPRDQSAHVLRMAFELGLPIFGAFLAPPLLQREWAQGTLAQLALRTPLVRVLLLRLVLLVACVSMLVIVSALLTTNEVRGLHTNDLSRWITGTLLTALPPMLLLVNWALLIEHLTKSAVAGYLVAMAFWLANIFLGLSLPEGSAFRPFLLFGWSLPQASANQSWVVGKITLLMFAAVLFTVQVPLLRDEGGLIRSHSE